MSYQPTGHLIWSLAGSGLSTTLTASGNSGTWNPGTGGNPPEQTGPAGPQPLTGYTDLGLYVAFAGAVTGSITVQVNLYDDQGNLYPAALSAGAFTTTGAKPPVTGGLHGGDVGPYLVLPLWGRVAWTVTGGGASFAGTSICLYGR